MDFPTEGGYAKLPFYFYRKQWSLHMMQRTRMDHTLVTTNIQLEGYRVVKNLGVVRGIIVRSRSIIGNIGAAFQILFGGNISLYSQLCEQTRRDA